MISFVELIASNKTKAWRRIYAKAARKVFARKKTRHYEPSLIYAPDEFGPNDFLIDLASKAAGMAWLVPIDDVNPSLNDGVYCNIYPGEHYRLLKALAKILDPQVIVEVGTYTGMGARALMQGQSKGVVYTYDILPWDFFESHLVQKDFDDKKMIQKLADLSNEDEFDRHLDLLNEAQIIFVDAPKDGQFEYQFLPLLKKLKPKENRLLILDDIRFVNMADLWISIQSPKLDISSFGHWSGTGLIDISQPLKLAE